MDGSGTIRYLCTMAEKSRVWHPVSSLLLLLQSTLSSGSKQHVLQVPDNVTGGIQLPKIE